MATTTKKNRPHKTLLRRRNCEGAVWRNIDSQGRPFYTTSITRSYKDRDGNWQNDSISASLDEIPRLIALLKEAEHSMYRAIQEDYEAGQNEADAA